MRILVVEDEPDLAGAIATGLRREGYAVDIAADGRSALERIPVTEYDLVCLDLNLPDMDGLDVCREIAERRAAETGHLTRVLMLDRHVGESRTASPGSTRVPTTTWSSRSRSASSLLGCARCCDASREPPERSSSGRASRLDGARQDVHHGTVRVDLNPKEYALLRWFLLHPNEVHSAERLLEHVWDEHADPFTNTVRVTMSNLRRKLAAAGATDVIETLPGRGYRLRAA